MTIIEIHSHATPFMLLLEIHNRALENKIECHIRKLSFVHKKMRGTRKFNEKNKKKACDSKRK